MEQTADPPLLPAKTARLAGLPLASLLTLLGALVGGALAVVQLRQEWARASGAGLWLLLVAASVAAASALGRLDLWLPGQPVAPRLAAAAAPRRRLAGLACVLAALGLALWLARRLWPDYRDWSGTPPIWLLAIGLLLLGAWLLGSAGRASPRAATAHTLWPSTPRARLYEALAVGLIFALAIGLRTYRLGSIPPGIYVDETNGALDALHILEGSGASPFATGWYETPNGYLYYMAGLFKLFGANWWSLKAASLIPAILTVPAVYLLGRLLFGPLAGLSAMLLIAVSRWHLSMSRWGWNQTAPPLFQVLAFFFLVRGLRDRRALDYALSGLLTGLGFYTYLSSRLAAATLVLYVGFWLWTDPAGPRAALARCWRGLALLLAGTLVAAAPLAVTYLTNPFSFSNRASEISVLRDIRDQQSLAPLLANLRDMLVFFHQTGDLQGKHNLPGEPMADPTTGLLLAVGLAYALLRWRDQRSGLLLLWLVLGLAGSFLSSHSESPQSYRAMTALPAVALLAAAALDRIARALYGALREERQKSHEEHEGAPAAAQPDALPAEPAAPPAIPFAPSRLRVNSANPAALAAGGLVLAALAGATLWESSVYFGRQASSLEVLTGFNPTENRVARETIAAVQAGTSVYLSPTFSEYSPLRFLLYGVVKASTGENTLERPPYGVVLPEVSLPLPATGHDLLLLLGRDYWPLRDYIASFYPQATMTLERLPNDEPIMMRVAIPQAQAAALQGLNERLTYADGRTAARVVPQLALPDDPQVAEAEWTGALRVQHGGEYELGGGGLQVFLDGQPWPGQGYLGRGIYGLRVVRPRGSSGAASLAWRQPEQEPAPVPPEALFRISWPQQGLLGRYYRNRNWEGPPLFQQVAPFFQLAWPDEQPVVPAGEWSARYQGALQVAEPGRYQLRIEADDGARLTLDGQVLGEGLEPGRPNELTAEVDLAAGAHPIQIDYFQAGGGTALRFYWSRDGGLETPVPPAALTPAQP